MYMPYRLLVSLGSEVDEAEYRVGGEREGGGRVVYCKTPHLSRGLNEG